MVVAFGHAAVGAAVLPLCHAGDFSGADARYCRGRFVVGGGDLYAGRFCNFGGWVVGAGAQRLAGAGLHHVLGRRFAGIYDGAVCQRHAYVVRFGAPKAAPVVYDGGGDGHWPSGIDWHDIGTGVQLRGRQFTPAVLLFQPFAGLINNTLRVYGAAATTRLNIKLNQSNNRIEDMCKIGKKLLDEIKEISKTNGWYLVRWQTDEDNFTAKKLYDKVAIKTKKNVYELKS